MPEIPQQKITALEKKVGTGAKSPLFARLASYYIQAGKATEALQMCDTGLATFPHYTTGHLVKGKALLALKMNAEARREFELVQEFLPANESVAFILSNIRPGDGESLMTPPAEPVAFEPSSEKDSFTPAPEPVPPPQIPEEEPQSETATATAVADEPSPFAPPSEPAEPANSFEAVAANTDTTDDPFGLAGGTAMETPTPSEPATVEEIVDPFAGFPTQPEPETIASSNTFDFPSDAGVVPAGEPEEESFESYAGRMRGVLVGENSLTLEEYLHPSQGNVTPARQEPSVSTGESIENLAEKLQTARKITPVIDLSTKATIPASEADTPASTGFVTPTLAEIYAKQGWYDDAIKAYHTLCITKPAEKERFEKRIAELEELKKQQS